MQKALKKKRSLNLKPVIISNCALESSATPKNKQKVIKNDPGLSLGWGRTRTGSFKDSKTGSAFSFSNELSLRHWHSNEGTPLPQFHANKDFSLGKVENADDYESKILYMEDYINHLKKTIHKLNRNTEFHRIDEFQYLNNLKIEINHLKQTIEAKDQENNKYLNELLEKQNQILRLSNEIKAFKDFYQHPSYIHNPNSPKGLLNSTDPLPFNYKLELNNKNQEILSLNAEIIRLNKDSQGFYLVVSKIQGDVERSMLQYNEELNNIIEKLEKSEKKVHDLNKNVRFLQNFWFSYYKTRNLDLFQGFKKGNSEINCKIGLQESIVEDYTILNQDFTNSILDSREKYSAINLNTKNYRKSEKSIESVYLKEENQTTLTNTIEFENNSLIIQINQLKNNYAQTLDKINTLESNLSEKASELTTKTEEISNLNEKISNLTKKDENQSKTIIELLTTINNLEETKKHLLESLEKLRFEIQNIKLKGLESDEILAKRYMTISEEITLSKINENKYEKEISKLLDENSSLVLKIQEIQADSLESNSKLNLTISSLQKTIKIQYEKINSLESAIKNFEIQINHHKNNENQMIQRLEISQKEIIDLKSEINQKSLKIQEIHQEYIEFNQKILSESDDIKEKTYNQDILIKDLQSKLIVKKQKNQMLKRNEENFKIMLEANKNTLKTQELYITQAKTENKRLYTLISS